MTWALRFDACTACGTTDRPHRAKGLCRRCYGAQPDVAARHYQAKKRRAHTPEGRAVMRRRYQDNAKYRERHKARMWVENMNRRARRVGAVGQVTLEDLLGRIQMFGGRCWMCGADWEHIDHVKPLSKGGAHLPSNLRPACAHCNGSKHNQWDGVAALAQSAA